MTIEAAERDVVRPLEPGPLRLIIRGTATAVLVLVALTLLFDLWGYLLTYIGQISGLGPFWIEYPLIGSVSYPNILTGLVTGMIYGATLIVAPLALWAVKLATPGPLSGWPRHIVNVVSWSYAVGWSMLWGLYILFLPSVDLFTPVPGGLAVTSLVLTAFWSSRRTGALQPVMSRAIPGVVASAALLAPLSFGALVLQEEAEAYLPYVLGLWFVAVALLLGILPMWLWTTLLRGHGKRRTLVAGLLATAVIVLLTELWMGGLPLE